MLNIIYWFITMQKIYVVFINSPFLIEKYVLKAYICKQFELKQTAGFYTVIINYFRKKKQKKKHCQLLIICHNLSFGLKENMFLCICFYAFVNTPQRFIWKFHFTCSSYYILFLNFLKNYFVFKNIISFQNIFMCISLVFLSFYSTEGNPYIWECLRGLCLYLYWN